MADDGTQAEIEQNRRDRRTWWAMAALGVVVAALALSFGWRIVEARLDAAKKLDGAMQALNDTGPTVISADATVLGAVAEDDAAKAVALLPRIGAARTALSEAATLSVAGFDRLTDDEQKQALLVQAAAKARLELLDTVPPLLTALESAAEAEALAAEAWDRALAADKLARESVASYNKLTKVGVRNAAAANEKAKAEFQASRDLFDRAITAFPDADLEVFASYVEERLALVDLSSKADEAWLAGKSTQANTLIAANNEKSAAAAKRAAKLPASPVNAIADAYEKVTSPLRSKYREVRQKVTEADELLRTM